MLRDKRKEMKEDKAEGGGHTDQAGRQMKQNEETQGRRRLTQQAMLGDK